MFANMIKHRLVDMGLTVQKLGGLMGVSQPTMANHIKKDNFTEKQMKEIAELLGCDLEIKLVPKEGSESMYSEYTPDKWKEIIGRRKR